VAVSKLLLKISRRGTEALINQSFCLNCSFSFYDLIRCKTGLTRKNQNQSAIPRSQATQVYLALKAEKPAIQNLSRKSA